MGNDISGIDKKQANIKITPEKDQALNSLIPLLQSSLYRVINILRNNIPPIKPNEANQPVRKLIQR